MHYQVHDRRNGRIFRVDRDIARALHEAQSYGLPKDEGLMRRLYGFISANRTMLTQEQSRAKPFNPLFVQIPLIDLEPWQPRLMGLARLCVGPQFWVLFAGLAVIAALVGSANDWAILAQFGQIFSIAALASFAVVAPFLKIFHELGHLLVATRFGVPVRTGGLFFVGLFPMPFVDCSMADVTANRNQRISISLAGLAVDLCISLIALIAWHFAPGGFGKTLLANIFFFSSLNSVLFNANPLIKLDGYYALSDWLGRRNLGTQAQNRLKQNLRWVTHLGGEGTHPRTREDVGLAGFGLLSMFYRINILVTIAWIMLPRFFGLGLALVAWGGYVMFLSPLLTSTATPDPQKGKTGLRRLIFWGGFIGVLAAVMLLVRMPFVVILPLHLDREDTYRVSFLDTGLGQALLQEIAEDGRIEPGETLFIAENFALEQTYAVLRAEQALMQSARDVALGLGPAEVMAATERLSLITRQIEQSEQQRSILQVTAPAQGVFVADPQARVGAGILDGQSLGAFYPDAGATILRGQFPDRYVDMFQQAQRRIELRIDGVVNPELTLENPELFQITSRDAETGDRSYAFVATLQTPPSSLISARIQARVRLGNATLWEHATFQARQLQERYWEARIANAE